MYSWIILSWSYTLQFLLFVIIKDSNAVYQSLVASNLAKCNPNFNMLVLFGSVSHSIQWSNIIWLCKIISELYSRWYCESLAIQCLGLGLACFDCVINQSSCLTTGNDFCNYIEFKKAIIFCERVTLLVIGERRLCRSISIY